MFSVVMPDDLVPDAQDATDKVFDVRYSKNTQVDFAQYQVYLDNSRRIIMLGTVSSLRTLGSGWKAYGWVEGIAGEPNQFVREEGFISRRKATEYLLRQHDIYRRD